MTRQRIYLETMDNVYRAARKVIVDTKNGNNNMIYLPLDKLLAPGSPLSSIQNDVLSSPQSRIPEIQVIPAEDPARKRETR